MYKVTNHFIPKLISDAPIQNPELQNQSDQKNQAQLSMTNVLMVFSNKKKINVYTKTDYLESFFL